MNKLNSLFSCCQVLLFNFYLLIRNRLSGDCKLLHAGNQMAWMVLQVFTYRQPDGLDGIVSFYI